MTNIRPKLLAVTLLAALFCLSCAGGGSDSGGVQYEEEEVIAKAAEKRLQGRSKGIDLRIAKNAAPEDYAAAKRLSDKIAELMSQMHYGESYAETVNYSYWDVRSRAEARDGERLEPGELAW